MGSFAPLQYYYYLFLDLTTVRNVSNSFVFLFIPEAAGIELEGRIYTIPDLEHSVGVGGQSWVQHSVGSSLPFP